MNDHCYHIINRSIAQYKIFDRSDDCERFMQILDLYRYIDFPYKYSNFQELTMANQQAVIKNLEESQKYLKIIAYCLMPTHFHLILYQCVNDGITKFMTKILDSFTRYFNLRHQRKGPLWEGHFKNILVSTDEQLLHLTRYLHLNPVSAGLVNKPEKWALSSYKEYIDPSERNLCEPDNFFDISPNDYKKFVNSRIAYQKELSKIKHLLMEDYTG